MSEPKQYVSKADGEAEVEKVFEVSDRQELADLISIRQYVVNAAANPAIDRATVNYLNGSLIMLDRKILGLLQDVPFKKYINYGDVAKAIQEVRNITNIKSGLKK